MNGTNWLCPSVDSNFSMQGKYTSGSYSYIDMSVYACGSINVNATCANKSDIERVMENIVQFSVYYINALILPGSQVPVTYYLADRDFVYFGTRLSGANTIFVSDYQITTDHSILPYSDNVVQTGAVVI